MTEVREGEENFLKPLKLRFAPAPGGAIHLGHLWILYCNFRVAGDRGSVSLRVDDTAKTATKEWINDLLDICNLFNFKFEKIYQQSLREPFYKSTAKKLKLFYNEGTWVTKTSLGTYRDEVRGRVLEKREDQVTILLKSNGKATYHLSSISDDWREGITDIVRSNDHLDNSFIHANCFAQLNYSPRFWHFPLILSSRGEKLSKRKQNYSSVRKILASGILPSTLKDFLEESYISSLKGKSSPLCFDINLIRKLNRSRVKSLEIQEVLEWSKFLKLDINFEILKHFLRLVRQGRYRDLLHLLEESNFLYFKLRKLLRDFYQGRLDLSWNNILQHIITLDDVCMNTVLQNLERVKMQEFRIKFLDNADSPSTIELMFILKSINGCT